ncbi:hypothetical protein K7432_011269 [Basidiobolus ranarum]|uniref:CUE domain-containing protein n=1 Tax=Basidiobolus ranarum TaxID=34480 RepID=A0ABR2VUK1_9FUNG
MSGLDALRAQILTTTGAEERVEVNQRHLIDKILARYSAEYVVYRELMQNSDDAGAKGIEIHFHTTAPESASTVPNLKAKLRRVEFKNNGMYFRAEDWNRLKKIAEGNPDESKIGAFGVGFYSLFSICEDPFVSSGSECMAFYWRNDQLYAKRGPREEGSSDPWTTFVLDLREPMEMPNMDDFRPFLARSIGFTVNLKDISVFLNQHRLLHLSKKMTDPQPLILPKTMYTASPQKIFTLKSVDLQSIQLDATMMDISRWKGEVTTSTSSIFLRTASGHLDVKVTKQQATEMERTTKKYPPSQTKIQILYSNFDDKTATADKKEIFKDLVPFPEQGRVFIGFPTHQTTGFCSHVAGRFIPTVERESLDFVDKCLQRWNHELLSMAGLLSRILYEDEMSNISKMYTELVLGHAQPGSIEDEATLTARTWLENRANHVLQAFQFHPSTPSPHVGRYIDGYFFRMSTQPLSILSSHGVKTLDKVRIPDPIMTQFLTLYPIISVSIYENHKKFMKKLEENGQITQISYKDVLHELEQRPLTEDQMVAMLRWWLKYRMSNAVSEDELFRQALVTSSDRVTPLASLRWLLNPKIIPTDIAVPNETLPYSISKSFSLADLSSMFRLWTELSLLEWIKFIANLPDLEQSPNFSEKVLGVVSRGWTTISVESQNAIVALLAQRKCIPTKHGMKLPTEAYFKNVTLFPDLPIIVFTKQPLEKLLQLMGVRKSVDLQLVFDRLVHAGSWDHLQLVKYLTSVQDTLTPQEIQRLKATSILPKEGSSKSPPGTTVQDNGNDTATTTPTPIQRYPASALYAPNERLASLGLPIIEWKGRWRPTSDEAKFLHILGLMTHPPLATILALAAPPTEKAIRTKALHYLIENFKSIYVSKYSPGQITVPFLPTTQGTMETPSGCFSNPLNSVMNFPVLHGDLTAQADLLGVREYPYPAQLLKRLETDPPKTKEKGKAVFEYLARFQADFSHSHWSTLRNLEFIPLDDNGKLADPRSCYFDKKDSGFHPDLLTVIDFGKTANIFLASCGVKEEPSPVELAQLVVRSPHQFLNRNGGAEKYKAVLRQIASHMHVIRNHKALVQEMIKSPFLLGEKRISDIVDGSEQENKDESTSSRLDHVVVHYKLATAKEIYLIDDTVLQQIFTPLGAPMENLLESFYESLGSVWISKQVKESYKPKGSLSETRRSKQLQDLIVERAPLLLSDQRQIQQSGLYHDADWLATRLKVRQVLEIELYREFIPTKQTHIEATSACVVQDHAKNYYLLVTGQGEIDFFDVADTLAKLVLKKKSLNDSFLWSSLLSTSLINLKRKGFPVDRILNAKKAEIARIEAAEKVSAAAAAAALAASKLSAKQTEEYLSQLKELFPDCEPGYLANALSEESEDHVQRVTEKLLESGYPKIQKPLPGSFPNSSSNNNRISKLPEPQPNALPQPPNKSRPSSVFGSGALSSGYGGSLFNKLKSLSAWGKDSRSNSPRPSLEGSQNASPTTSGVIPSGSESPSSGHEDKGGIPQPIKSFSPDYHNNLQNSLKAAISNCCSNAQDDIDTKPTVSQVSEDVTKSYCDAKPGHQLNFVGHAGALELYLDKSCDADEIMTKENLKSLARFVQLLMSLANVFELVPDTMHVFYDPEGPTVAFNRGGALFFNWRYFVALGHDSNHSKTESTLDTKLGSGEVGMIYWFFTMAHELAHNFVGEHNSQHEFYFSSFCEQYLPALIDTLTKSRTSVLATIVPPTTTEQSIRPNDNS